MQQAKADYTLAKALIRLDGYALLVFDDIGYERKDEAETSVLFELVMPRSERKSLLVSSNQPFSEWQNVFSTSAMTVAVVDRVVDYSTILKINGESYRRRRARRVGRSGGRLIRRPDGASITRQPDPTPSVDQRLGAPRCRRTLGSAGPCAPRWRWGGGEARTPANRVDAWRRSENLSRTTLVGGFWMGQISRRHLPGQGRGVAGGRLRS